MWPFKRKPTEKRRPDWPYYRVEEAMLPSGEMGWALVKVDLWCDSVSERRIALLPDRAAIEKLCVERYAELDANECRRR